MATLQNGSQGSEVKNLQMMLNQVGYSLTEDGVFGPATGAAVRDFQKAHGLTADGVAGPVTMAALSNAIGTGTTTVLEFDPEVIIGRVPTTTAPPATQLAVSSLPPWLLPVAAAGAGVLLLALAFGQKPARQSVGPRRRRRR